MSKKYVKVWEKHNGRKLPKNMEIHHIDGDNKNNDPKNLMAVTIEEHLEIHKRQNDYGAVQAILMRMNMSDEQRELIKECASNHQKKLIEEGKHNFQKISKEEKQKISREVGLKTSMMKVGIHRINNDPILAKENGKSARSKLSREKELEMMLNWKKKIEGSKWWVNQQGKRKRSKIKPEGEWKEGMIYDES
jgi:hypothetical protein